MMYSTEYLPVSYLIIHVSKQYILTLVSSRHAPAYQETPGGEERRADFIWRCWCCWLSRFDIALIILTSHCPSVNHFPLAQHHPLWKEHILKLHDTPSHCNKPFNTSHPAMDPQSLNLINPFNMSYPLHTNPHSNKTSLLNLTQSIDSSSLTVLPNHPCTLDHYILTLITFLLYVVTLPLALPLTTKSHDGRGGGSGRGVATSSTSFIAADKRGGQGIPF